ADHSFNYQGELVDSGSPANDVYDFQVQMVDGNSQDVGTVSEHIGVTVTNGLFNLDVELGGIDYFDGYENYYFEVSVRKTSVGGAYTALSPVQALQAVPLATNLVNGSATANQVLTFNGFQWQPMDPAGGSSPWTENSANVSYDGTVGIGATTIANVDLFINSDTGRSPLLARINNIPKLSVNANGGTTLGFVFAAPPVNGLLVQGVSDFRNNVLIDGNVGIGTVNPPAADLQIDATIDGDVMRVRVAGTTKFYLDDNGGAGVGSWVTPPVNGLQVSGRTRLTDTTDATLAGGSGVLVIGAAAGKNIVMDGNEIMARDNGVASTLFVGASGSTGTHVNGTTGSGLLAIGASTSSIQIDGDDIQRKVNGAANTLFLNFYGGNVRIGSAGATTTILGTVSTPSDKRLKEDIIDLPYGLAEIMMLKPKAYNWIGVDNANKSFGLIAQDVSDVMQELVHELDNDREEKEGKSIDKTLSLSYTEMIPVLINAIQEQQLIIEEQDRKINQLIKASKKFIQ
ncbi:hypothetical protein MNBD_GAMMA03-1311, partial [hydrothermal vent metagenome]